VVLPNNVLIAVCTETVYELLHFSVDLCNCLSLAMYLKLMPFAKPKQGQTTALDYEFLFINIYSVFFVLF